MRTSTASEGGGASRFPRWPLPAGVLIGVVAGHFFSLSAWVGVAIATVAVAILDWAARRAARKQAAKSAEERHQDYLKNWEIFDA